MLPAFARWIFIVFFSTHIVITLLLDIQALPIGGNYPEVLQGLIRVSRRPLLQYLRITLLSQHNDFRAFLID